MQIYGLTTPDDVPMVVEAGADSIGVVLDEGYATWDQVDLATARAQAALSRVFALTLSLGGTLSGEHGIGLAKRAFMADAIDAPTLALMRQVKAVFDPDGILNPGKLLPPG